MAEIFGTNVPDVLSGTDEADQIRGWAADNPPGDEGPHTDRDMIDGGAGNDNLWGGAGADDLTGGLGDDSLHGGAGDDTLRLGDGLDLATGGSGADVLLDYGQGGRMSGNAGEDTIVFHSGDEVGILSGGKGVDLLDLQLWDLTIGVTLSFSDPLQEQILWTGTRISGFERVTIDGTTGDDQIAGGSYADNIYGSDGNDLILGGGGNDHLQGGLGHNTLQGGRGDDVLFAMPYSDDWGYFEGDTIVGGAGVDRLYLTWDNWEGLSLSMGAPGTRHVLPGGTSFRGIESLHFHGGHGADCVVGGALGDYLNGGDGGDDTLAGGGGNDWIEADGWSDSLNGGDGDDTIVVSNDLYGSTLVGGEGIDTLRMDQVYLGWIETFVLNLRHSDRTSTIVDGTTLTGIERLDLQLYLNETRIIGGAYDDHIESSAEGNDSLHGAGGNDTLDGGWSGNDLLFGGHGNDSLTGGWRFSFQDDDSLYGGFGNDNLLGENGNDLLSGGKGSDLLTGGAGLDRFLFDTAPRVAEIDTITDFAHDQDLILLSASAFPGLTPGPLSPDSFVQGRHALDADDHLIWHRATGLLCYDPDGSGAQAEIAFAHLSTRHLAATDILIT